jgi:hypothetical protein
MTTGEAKDVNLAISNRDANIAFKIVPLDKRRTDKGFAEK